MEDLMKLDIISIVSIKLKHYWLRRYMTRVIWTHL